VGRRNNLRQPTMCNSRSKGRSPKQSGKNCMFGRSLNVNFFKAVICCKPSTSSPHLSIVKSSRQVNNCKPAPTFNLVQLYISNFLRECNPCSDSSSTKKFGHSSISRMERRGNRFFPFSRDSLVIGYIFYIFHIYKTLDIILTLKPP